MDIGDNGGGDSSPGGFEDEKPQRPKQLPDDLPRSLDDRRNVPTHFAAETEMYDAWQGRCIRMNSKDSVLIVLRTVPVPDSTCPCETTPIQFFGIRR